MTEQTEGTTRGLSRRGALGLLGVTAVGAAAAGTAGYALGQTNSHSSTERAQYDFFGETQSGVTTPVQNHMYFAAYDMFSTANREDLISLLKDWSYAADRLMRGEEVSEDGALNGPALKPPDDTGEALDLPPHGLTITIGFGPTLFTDNKGRDRFGIARFKPAELEPLPLFKFDLIQEEISGGDLCIQACANDPQVAVHAIRNLSRIAFGRAMIRWTQLGFGRTSSTSRDQMTPRNLFGFKDGTANIMSEEQNALNEWVWVDQHKQSWVNGGTYLVARKIQMTIENWDRVNLQEQEQIFGRDKGEGAPLSGGREFDEPDFKKVNDEGGPTIPLHSHMRLAHPDSNRGQRMLRRGYNYVDGNNELGQLDAGLFFIAFQRDPAQFIEIQQSLSTDLLNEYIRHIGSSIFVIPPGVNRGGFVGETLLT